MAVLKTKDIREMATEERFNRLKELKEELMHERGVAAMGGAPTSPGRIRAVRTSIARLMTVMNEEGDL
jgi:large subunit ribosomal protein L29